MTEQEYKQSLNLIQNSVFTNIPLQWVESFQPGIGQIIANIEREVVEWADLNKPIWDSDPAQSGTYNAVKNELLVFAQNLQKYKDDPARSEVIYDFINAARSLYSFNKNYGLDTTPLTNAVNPFKLSVVSSRVTSFGYMHFKSLSNLVKFNEDLLASIDDEKIQLKGYTKTVLEPVREKLYKLITEDPEFKNLLDELGFGEVDDFIQSFAPNTGALEALTDEFFSNFNTFVGNISARLDTERETTDLAIADARADAQESIDEALGRVDNLVADLSTYQTGVNTQIQSIQSAYESLNSTVQSNVSRIDATEAAIIQEATTRADGFVATASQINAIVSRIDDVDASIIQEANTRASEDAATVDRIDQLVTRVDDNAAAIVNEQNARTTALLAEATARETLAAQLKTDGELYASGLVTSEANVRASQDEILGERIDLVSAEVGGISTAIINEQTARITGDEAEATSRKALSTKLFGTDVIDGITVDTLTSGFLYDQQQSIITQTESAVTNVIGQIAQIETDLTNTRADLLTETTTRVNEYGTIATSVTALSTQFNNQKATLDSLNSIVSGPDGITTQWGIKSDINGYITGVGLISSSKYGTPTSQFIVYADQFALVTPGVNGGQPTLPFFVGSEQGYLELSNTVKSNWNNITGSNKPADNATRNVFRGDWAISTSYVVGDIVLKDGNGWSCILAHASTSGNQPPVSGSGNTWWTLYAVKGSDGAQGLHALTVLVPNNAHTLPAASDGVVASYTGSGTAIQIFEGTTALSAVSSITANGQFTIGTPTQLPASTITVGARSYSGTTATVAQHSAMAAGTDSVVVTYPITVRRSDGTTVTLSATQTLTKSKAGPSGTPGDWVSYVFRESASKPTTPTGTATAPVGWLDDPPSSYTNPIWMSKATVSGATGLAGTWSSPVQVTGVNGTNGTNGASGADGSYVVFQYAKNTSATTAPTSGWTASPPSLATGEFAWMRSGTVIPPATSPASWDTGYRVSGEKGEPGLNGSRTAILDMYRWAASAPTTFPSGNSTYTWATGQFTAPATTNGWSLTPPAPVAGQTLWIARTLYSDSLTTATTSIAWSATTAIPLAAAGTSGTNGTNGANGTRTAYLELYRWAASVPTTFPSGTSTYTWATGTFTAPGTLNEWSLTPGTAVAGQTLWACAVTYADNNTTATSSVAWNTSTAFAIGAAGTNGTNGVNAKAAFLTATSQVFQIAKTGTTTPSSITLTATGQNVTGSPTFAVTSGTAVLTGTGNERTLASTGLTTDTATIRIQWDGQEDFITVVKVREGNDGAQGPTGSDGINGLTVVVSNESHTLPASSTGVVSSYTNSGATIQVYEGATLLTAVSSITGNSQFTIGTPTQSPASTIAVGTRSYFSDTATVANHSAMANDTDSVVITYPISIRRANGSNITINKTQTLTKSKVGAKGDQGTMGPTISINSNRASSFTSTDGTLDGSQADIVFAATVTGIASPTYTWTFTGLQTNPTASTTASQTITAAQFGTSKSATVTCTVNPGGYKDTFTIVRLEKSTAAPGATVGADWYNNVTNRPDPTSFLETFESGSVTQWTNYAGAGELSVVPASDSLTGGKVLRIGNNSGNDQAWLIHKQNIPFDPSALYRIKFRVRRTAGTGMVWLGVAGVAADGVTFVNVLGDNNYGGQHYVAASYAGPSSTWTEYVGYVKGTAATGQNGTNPPITAPLKLHQSVKYIRPLILVNHQDAAGTTEVDYCSIELMTDAMSWDVISGAGKPEDGATVGATWGENIVGLPYDTIYNNDDSTALGFNPTFSAWSGALPDGYGKSGTFTISKETTIKRVGAYSVKCVVPTGATGYQYITKLADFSTTPMPAGTFVSGTVDVYVGAYTSGGKPGLKLRLHRNAAKTLYTDADVAANTSKLGSWQRIPFSVRLTGAQQIHAIQVYLMAAASTETAFGGSPFIGTVYFDNLRFALFDSSVDNTSITISSDGTLSGAGGGSVTITGLGYSGDLNATNGAPAGTLVAGVSAASVADAVTDFNASNNRNGAAITAPTILTDGTAVDHVAQKDGSVDISFEWGWSGNEGDIDGFLVYVRPSTSSTAYTLGTTPAEETVYIVPANKRAFVLFGVAADKYYTFGVQAYRAVDKAINAAGVIKSTLVKATGSGENPYRPSSTVAFTGDVTGTISGTNAATLVSTASNALTNANAAQAAANTANNTLADIASDNKLTPVEKQSAANEWGIINRERASIQAQASALGISSELGDYNYTYAVLNDYITPLLADLQSPSAIDGPTFRDKWSYFYEYRQRLMNKMSAVAATKADWASVQSRPSDAQLLNNLLDTSTWTGPSHGGVVGFSPNGSDYEQYRRYRTLPDGSQGISWYCYPGLYHNNAYGWDNPQPGSSPAGDADGGWNTTAFPITSSRGYRFSVWVCHTGGNTGTAYLGCGGGSVRDMGGGAVNPNPYFVVHGISALIVDRWYLFVGYVHPEGRGGEGQTSLSGIYDGTTGAKVASGTDYCWAAGATTSVHRAYLYYAAPGSHLDFVWPRVDMLNGMEPSLAQLLAMGSVSARNPITSSNVSTYIANAAIGNAQIDRATVNKLSVGRLDIQGQAVSVVSYYKSGLITSSTKMFTLNDFMSDSGAYIISALLNITGVGVSGQPSSAQLELGIEIAGEFYYAESSAVGGYGGAGVLGRHAMIASWLFPGPMASFAVKAGAFNITNITSAGLTVTFVVTKLYR